MKYKTGHHGMHLLLQSCCQHTVPLNSMGAHSRITTGTACWKAQNKLNAKLDPCNQHTRTTPPLTSIGAHSRITTGSTCCAK
jgi:hypothetical protein